MKPPRGLWHGLGLVAVLTLLLLPASASAATSVRAFHAEPFLAAHLAAPTAPPVTVGASATVHFVAAPGYAAAGTQGSASGLQGTTVVLPGCAGACTDRYRSASSVAIAAGHYAERVRFTVTQPGRAGTAVGFDVEVAVELTTGWVVGMGYFSTGVATTVATSTITLAFYVDLGTAVPTVLVLHTTVNACTATTGCP